MIHISEYDIFKMKKGMKVFNKKTEERGIILGIEETGPEYIEPRVKWSSGVEEILKSYPHIFIEETDPTLYCSGCGALSQKDDKCGPIAENE